MDRKEKIIQLAREMGVIRPRDVENRGIPRQYLHRLYQQGVLVRMGWGLYSLPDAMESEFTSLVEVSKRVPKAVVCLLSALQFHSLTTQLHNQVWIAIEGTSWRPEMDYPQLRVVRFSGNAFHYGIEEHKISQIPVRVYSPAKTVADCFKFRNKIGIDIAIEALRETRKLRKATMDDLWKAAKICRVAGIMNPYLEAVV